MMYHEILYNMGQSLKFLLQQKIQWQETDKSGQVMTYKANAYFILRWKTIF